MSKPSKLLQRSSQSCTSKTCKMEAFLGKVMAEEPKEEAAQEADTSKDEKMEEASGKCCL